MTTYNQRLIMGKRSLNRAEILILFIIWPFLGLLAACGQFQNRKTRFICVLFGALFGYTFVVGNESIDANRIVEEFNSYCNGAIDWEQWMEITLLERGTQLIIPLVTSAVSLFSDDYHVLFAIYGMFFSYFMTKTVGLLYDCNKNNSTMLKLLLVIFLLSLNFIFNINGIRMWLAMWVACYSLLAYWNGTFTRKQSYLLLALCMFIHWSFLFVFLLFVFYENFNIKKEPMLYILILLSFALRPFFAVAVQNLPLLGGFYEDKVMGYTSEEANERVMEKQQNASFLYGIYRIFFSPAVLLLLLFVRRKVNLQNSNVLKCIYCLSLIVYAISNAGADVLSVGRFFILFQSLAVFFIYSALNITQAGTRMFITVCLLPLLGFSCMNSWMLGRVVMSENLFLPLPFYLL